MTVAVLRSLCLVVLVFSATFVWQGLYRLYLGEIRGIMGPILGLGFFMLLRPLLLAQPAMMHKRTLRTGWKFSNCIARDAIISIKEMPGQSVTWIKILVADPTKRTGVRTLWIVYFEPLCGYQPTPAERLASMCKLRKMPRSYSWWWFTSDLWLQPSAAKIEIERQQAK